MPESPLIRPAPLDTSHITASFESRDSELDEWLHRFALVNHQSGNARVFVAARGDRVVGYYALATATCEKEEASEQITKGGVAAQIPCLLLARLAVDRSDQNRKIGRGLLVDAIRRLIRVSEDVGVRALLIHARDEDARAFYLHHGEFLASPTDPLHLFMHIKHARRLLD